MTIKRFKKKHKIAISIIQITIFSWLCMMVLWAAQSFQVNATMANQAWDMSAQSMYTAAQKQKLSQDLLDQLDKSAHIKTSDTQRQLSQYWIAKYFGKEAPTAEKVFTCESNLNPMAENDKNTNGTSDLGVPQINTVHAKEFEKMYGTPFVIGAHDTQISIQYAKYLYDHQGWGPWTCSKIVGVV